MSRSEQTSMQMVAGNWRKWSLWLVLCTAFTGAVFLASSYFGRMEGSQRSFLGIPISPYGQVTPPKLGAVHGVRLAIPAKYLFFPVEYEGEDPWAPRKTKPVRKP